jgi:integrase/recombinase XerD
MLKQRTFSEIAVEFLQDRKMTGKSNDTLIWYERHINEFSKWLIINNYHNLPIEDLDSSLLKSYFLHLATNHNKGGIHAAYRAIKAIFNFYDFEYEPIWKNPIKKVKISPSHQTPLPEIPIENIQKLIDSTISSRNRERDRAILFTLTDTGVRASELLALNVKDVDLATGSIRVLHGKGDKFRVTFLGEKGRKALHDYLRTRTNLTQDEPLFLNDENQRLGMAGLRMLITRLSKRAKVPYQAIHSFRRCFALTMFRKTRDIFLVSRLCGHSTVEVTKRYLNINNEDLRFIHESNSPGDMLI